MHHAIGIVNAELAGKVWRHHGGEVTFYLLYPRIFVTLAFVSHG
jgi:hypothetical protein